MTLTLSWRGPLDDCNYACAYCPFATRPARRTVLDADRAALERFVTWVEGTGPEGAPDGRTGLAAAGAEAAGSPRAEVARGGDPPAATDGGSARTSSTGAGRRLRIRFTPYGEALHRPWYPAALARLSALAHVEGVSLQTNGSARPASFGGVPSKVTLWVSYHPTEVALGPFLARLQAWDALGVRLAVGAVAEPANEPALLALRAALPASWPLWLNARKPGVRYSAADVARWSALDPDFGLEARPLRSRGLACGSGETGLCVDGRGELTRCVLVPEVLGNLYTDDLDGLLRPRPCPRATCTCWLGYAQTSVPRHTARA